MKNRILLCISLIFSLSATAMAQGRTVTNADLEKFRQNRLAAEKDYRENYARLGFPSPQEREREIAESLQALSEQAARFEAERLERERLDLWQTQENSFGAQTVLMPSPNDRPVVRNYYYGYTPNVFSIGYYNLPRYRSGDRRKRYWRNNNILTIRPPKPIRPPRPFYSPNSRWRKR